MTARHEWPLERIKDLLERKHLHMTDVVRLAEVGSTVHGISVGGQDDLDLTGIRIEGWHELVNGPAKRQSMMVRTAQGNNRSMPGDIDIQLYTLRKFIDLALGGNPSILTALYSPKTWDPGWATQHIDWEHVGTLVASKRAGQAFKGYMRQQMERWQGLRGQRNVNRPELVEAHGFDTKYAAHVIRLGLQGIEYVTHGTLTLPMPAEEALQLRSLRVGRLSEAEAITWANEVEAWLMQAIDHSPLPDQPNVEGARRWLAQVYHEVVPVYDPAYD